MQPQGDIMALTDEQAAEVVKLRDITGVTEGELDNDAAYALIVEETSVEQAAARLWTKKAAGYAALVDTTEGASSRKLSQLHDQAMKMAARLSGSSTAGGTTGRTSRVRPIVRE